MTTSKKTETLKLQITGTQLDVPTLLIGGPLDPVTPTEPLLTTIAQAVPTARLVDLPGASHFSNLDQPEAFTRALIGHLRDARAPDDDRVSPDVQSEVTLPEGTGARRLLDLLEAHGYELVQPPLLEYTESLLSGTGRDLDLATFRLADRLSGRQLGVRADHTPQVARIDGPGPGRDGACERGHGEHGPRPDQRPPRPGADVGPGRAHAALRVGQRRRAQQLCAVGPREL